MNWIRTTCDVARNQAGVVKRVLSGRPGVVQPLNSLTLEQDDAQLAMRWLRDRSRWDDLSIVHAYETAFKRWNGSRYAFSFMGGRVALSACIYALGLEPGDEAVIPGYTCVVVPNAFRFAGLIPVYCDIELDTYGLDIQDLKKKITPSTKVIVLHHLYGLVSRDYEGILRLARERGIPVIEDCAHATGAEYKGVKVGNRGDCAFYSSEQSKVFNTVQGGLAVTNDERLASRMSAFHRRARLPSEHRTEALLHNLLLNYYQHSHPWSWLTRDLAQLRFGMHRMASTTREEERGVQPSNYGQRMPPPLASIGLNQLEKIDRFNARRREGAAYWAAWCDSQGYRQPVRIESSTPVFLRYPVLASPEMKGDHSWADSLNVEPGVWFRTHVHPVEEVVSGCPAADVAVERCINLPTILNRNMSDAP